MPQGLLHTGAIVFTRWKMSGVGLTLYVEGMHWYYVMGIMHLIPHLHGKAVSD
jgi:hypothetical protein